MLKRDDTAEGLTTVDVTIVLRIVERIAHGDANPHNVRVHLDLSSDVHPVKGNSVQLQQAISNLMLKPFSAMSGLDGSPRLAGRTRSVDESIVLIEVEDSGTGIAAATLESIFEPFATTNGKDWEWACRSAASSSTPRRHDLGCEQSRPRREVLDHPAGQSRLNVVDGSALY